MNQTIAYTTKVRYHDTSANPPAFDAKLISLWGGLPPNIQSAANPSHEMDLMLTVRVDDFGEPVDIFKHEPEADNRPYILLCQLLPGEVRTFNLTKLETIAGAVTAVRNADSLVHCVLHQAVIKLAP